MKNKKLILATIALSCTCYLAIAQDEKKSHTITAEVPAAKAEQEASQKAWQEYMRPGPMHEMLAKSNGDWQAEVKMWMTPGADPQVSTSHCTNTMILGGRYQQSMHRGDMMGMPFEGMSIVGYDNALKMYISTWVDNMGTGIMYMKGTYDEKNQLLTSTGKMVDAISGKEINVRQTVKFVDDNTQVMEMYDMRGPKEFKTMEITFKR